MLEMENVDAPAPHRIPFYNQWAKANSRPPYDDPRTLNGLHWFDYQTASIIKATKAIETAVRAKGFRGDLTTINKLSEKVGGNPRTKHQLVNIAMMRTSVRHGERSTISTRGACPTGNSCGTLPGNIWKQASPIPNASA